MSLNRLFNPLRLDADITLCDGGGAVLQKPLDKGDVEAVVLVDFRCVPRGSGPRPSQYQRGGAAGCR